MKVTVIDYGLSNLLSVQHAFAHFGAEVQVTSSPADVLAADALVLPGVGAFQDGMQGLEQLGLIEPIKQKTAQGTLLLGICLGMQMLFDESEEFGLHKGLGLIPGRVVKIPDTDADGCPQRVPHISWNPLYPGGSRADHTIANLQGLLFLSSHGAHCRMYGDGVVWSVLHNEKVSFPAGCGGTLSLFCMDGAARGVTIRGLKYELTDAEIRSDFPIGVSNSFTGAAASVEVRDGTLIMIHDIFG